MSQAALASKVSLWAVAALPPLRICRFADPTVISFEEGPQCEEGKSFEVQVCFFPSGFLLLGWGKVIAG